MEGLPASGSATDDNIRANFLKNVDASLNRIFEAMLGECDNDQELLLLTAMLSAAVSCATASEHAGRVEMLRFMALKTQQILPIIEQGARETR